jgi:tetratricopeptide (TPR) repeat protein
MLNTLGLARRDQGDFGEAAQFLERAIDEHRALAGEPRSELALTLNNLATVLFLQGEQTRAESLALEAYELSRKTLGENHLYTAYPLGTLAEIYYRQQNYPKARETIEHTMEIQQRALAGEHLDLVRSRVMLGKIVMRAGNLAEAEAIFRDALAKLEAAPGHVGAAGTRGVLGECLTLQNRFEEAEPLLLESYHALEQRLGGKDPRARDAARRLVVLYEAWHKPAKAAPFQ